MSRSHKKHVPRNNKANWYRIKVYRRKVKNLKWQVRGTSHHARSFGCV